MLNVEVHPEVYVELEESRAWYAVIYRVEQESIKIYAVSHHKRKPGYWLLRKF